MSIRHAGAPGDLLADVDRPVLDALGEDLCYWVLDRATGEGAGSARLLAMIGEEGCRGDLDALIGRFHPEDRDRLADAIGGLLDVGDALAGEFRLRGRDGRSLRVRIRGRVPLEDGPPRLLVLTFEDLTESRRADDELSSVRDELEARVRELARSNASLLAEADGRARTEGELDDSRVFYLSLVESVPYTIFRKDSQGRYTFGNRRYCEMHGIGLDRLIGKTDYDLYPAGLAAKYREDDRRTIDRGEVLDVEEEHRDPRNPDQRQFVHTIKCPIFDAAGRVIGIQGMFADVTERRRAAEQLAHQARHDSLTGLPNRDLFQERLEGHLVDASAASGRLAVLIVDLDRFKEINDTFGHHYGDRILQRLGPRLEAVLGPGDTVARLGGDEFGVILPGGGRERASAVAERLLAAIAEPIPVGGHRLDVGASIGVALCPDHGANRISLVQRADVAMYAAKKAQGGHAFYNSEQASYSPERLALLADLRRALAGGQFLLHYQPKIDLATRLPRGAEALIRWRHPREGLVSPGQFIPLAEQTGLIRSIDLWAASAAMADCRCWPHQARPLSVAVNLSASGLHDPDLVDQFARVLEESGLAPSRLIVEVTESAMMADPLAARSGLEGLHAMGLAIAIDDFGTGYSSLAYLKDLPIDEVKIDRSFMKDLAANGPNACIVRAVVDLGHNLGLRVTAEGVEDAGTLEILADLGCDLAQGYYISRPVPLLEFEEWVRRQFDAA